MSSAVSCVQPANLPKHVSAGPAWHCPTGGATPRFSQNQEDQTLLKYFANTLRGTFLEMGALDGVQVVGLTVSPLRFC